MPAPHFDSDIRSPESKGTVGLFQNHWLNLAAALILLAGVIAIVLYCLL